MQSPKTMERGNNNTQQACHKTQIPERWWDNPFLYSPEHVIRDFTVFAGVVILSFFVSLKIMYSIYLMFLNGIRNQIQMWKYHPRNLLQVLGSKRGSMLCWLLPIESSNFGTSQPNASLLLFVNSSQQLHWTIELWQQSGYENFGSIICLDLCIIKNLRILYHKSFSNKKIYWKSYNSSETML